MFVNLRLSLNESGDHEGWWFAEDDWSRVAAKVFLWLSYVLFDKMEVCFNLVVDHHGVEPAFSDLVALLTT